MPANAATKQQLQDTIDEVGEKLDELLNPVLTREQIIEGLQELDGIINGSDEEDEEGEGEGAVSACGWE